MSRRTDRRFIGRSAVTLVAAFLLALGARASAGGKTAAMVEIVGPIGPAVAEHAVDAIARAAERGDGLIIIRLDTPGGLDAAMRRINAAILASPVPVACWVAPAGARAASAGAYIFYACHVAAMAPGTNLGAATPVTMGGEMDDAAKAKAVNDAAAYLRSLAQLRGRNQDWAERAVREGVSLTAAEAASAKVADLIARDLDALLAGADGRIVRVGDTARVLSTKGLAVNRVEPGLRNRVLAVLTTPEVAYLLLLIGLYGIMFELMSPGAVFPGVAGGVSLLLGLYALNLLPVNYAGMALIVFGMALMLAEAFLPSFGVLGLGGAVAFALGSLMMFGSDVPGYQLSLGLVVGTTLASALFLVIGLAAAIRSRRGRPMAGGEALVGASATVERWDGEAGQVRLLGELWNARAARSLNQGDKVRVTRRDGLTLAVEPDVEQDPRRP